MKKAETMVAYMCTTDWLYELREPHLSFPELYKSLQDIRKRRVCVQECGITKVEIHLVKEVTKPDFSNPEKSKKKC